MVTYTHLSRFHSSNVDSENNFRFPSYQNHQIRKQLKFYNKTLFVWSSYEQSTYCRAKQTTFVNQMFCKQGRLSSTPISMENIKNLLRIGDSHEVNLKFSWA